MTIEAAGRAGRSPAAAALAVLLVLAGAAGALAVCGDGEPDPGELCDDGNLADGDCCTSSCGRPGYCDSTDRAGIIIKDIGDNRDDRLFWRYYRGQTSFEDWGDPLETTSYSFCIWDDDELKLQSHVDPGGFCHPRRPCWRVQGRSHPQGWRYFNKGTNDTGLQIIQLFTQEPSGNAYIAVRALDVNLPLPGPVAFDQYFNQTEGVTVQFVRSDAAVCWESRFIHNHQSNHRRFKAILKPNVDG